MNVIPDEVKMEGTFRSLDESWSRVTHEGLLKMAKGIAENMRSRCYFTINRGYPVLNNNEIVTGQSS